MWQSILQWVLVSPWQPPRARWHRAGRSYLVPTNLDHGGSVCWAISGMKVSLSGHLAGGCPNLRPMRAAFCGSGAERDLHPEGTEAPPPPTAVNGQSWATAHVRWESVGATALGREGASTTQSPSKGVTGAFGTQGTGSLGRRKVPENALLAPALRPAPPRTQRRAGARAAASGRIPAPPAACLCPPSAFVHEGCTKWPPQPSAILCRRRAGAGGREAGGDPCARRPAWPGRSPAPPRPRPALAPADVLAGRPGTLQTRAQRSGN